MKRASNASIFLMAAAMFVAASAAFAPAAIAQQSARAGIAQRSPRRPRAGTAEGVRDCAAGRETRSRKCPPPGAPTRISLSESGHEDSCPTGLRVFVVSDHREPAVAARLVILSAGSIKDPAGMPGVAEMTANLLTQGTEKRSAQRHCRGDRFCGRLAGGRRRAKTRRPSR